MPKVRGKLRFRSLMAAVSAGNLSETKRLLCLGKHPDEERNSSNDQTPIFVAVSQGSYEIFKHLLTRKASVSGEDIHGNSLLHIASNVNIVKTLLSAGHIGINARNKLQRTPIHCAIIGENFDVAKVLIEQGGDVNAVDVDGNTCLHLLSKCHRYLYMYIYEQDSGDYEITSTLERNYNIPFIKRHRKGGYHCALLEHEEDLYGHICRVTKYARTCQPENVDDMLRGLDRTSDVVSMAEKLIEHGADPTLQNVFGEVPLHFAVDGSNEGLVSLLCKSASSAINVKDYIGETPLLHCFSFIDFYEHERETELKRKEMILATLYENGADLNVTDINGMGILFSATDSVDCLNIVLRLEPRLDICSCTGASVLHVLASDLEIPDEQMVEILLKGGLDINCRDSFGATPLFYAAWAANLEWMGLLLSSGSEVDALDHSGKTAADLADFNKRDDIADLLRSAQTQDIDEQTEAAATEEEEKQSSPESNTSPDDSFEEVSLSNFKFPHERVLSIKRSSEVQTMFGPSTLPVDGDHYVGDLIESPVTGRMEGDPENREIMQAVLHLVHKISEQFEIFDPRFKINMELSGSVSEGVKCGRADEFDFLCCLVNFEDAFHPEEGESDPPGFVRIAASETGNDAFKEFQTKDGYLINAKLTETFYRFLYRAIHSQGVWESTKTLYPSLYFIPELKLQGPSVEMGLTWFGPKFKNLAISIDMVPAIYFKDWWPKSANDHVEGLGSIRAGGCHVVLTTYHNQDGIQSEFVFDLTVPRYFRISFTRAERQILRSVSQTTRDGFILAKALREQCQPTRSVYSLIMEPQSPNSCSDEDVTNLVSEGETSTSVSFYQTEQQHTCESDDNLSEQHSEDRSCSSSISMTDEREQTFDGTMISTYMLKMSLLHELNRGCCVGALGNRDTGPQDDTQIAFNWARKIYRRLQALVEQSSIPSFFIPGFDLLSRKDAKDFYVFDDKFTQKEMDSQSDDIWDKIVSCPLPEKWCPESIDKLPNDIYELKALKNTEPTEQNHLVSKKLEMRCFIENLLIYIALIECIFRECKEGKN